MRIYYVREAYLDQLRADIKNNKTLYQQNDPWLEGYFGNLNWSLQSNIVSEDFRLIHPQGNEHFDLENTKRVFNAMRRLTISQATDERLWVYLTHVTFWEYMRVRWPAETYIDKSTFTNSIIERYFFMGNRDRALIRNGLSRLWWYGYVSYDETRDDPYELTAMLLSKLDIAQSLLERSFSRNPLITKTVLEVLANLHLNNKTLPNREQFRKLMMYLNQLGGVTILDSLEPKEIQILLYEKISKLA